jgi:hypothetical protein
MAFVPKYCGNLNNCYDSAIQRAEYQSLQYTSSVSTPYRILLNIYQLPKEKVGSMLRQNLPRPSDWFFNKD